MPEIVGILLDFSKSMKETVYDKLDKRDGKRSRSIFKVIDDLIIKENILPDNRVFAIGCGTRCGLETMDIIGTIKHFYDTYAKSTGTSTYSENLDKVYTILEKHGAKSIRKALSETTFRKKVPYYLLALFLDALQFSSKFRYEVIELLPDVCKSTSYLGSVTAATRYWFEGKTPKANEIINDIQKCFLKDEKLVKRVLKEDTSVFKLDFAADAVRYWFEGKKIDDIRVQKVLQTINPIVYGENRLYTALEKSINIFKNESYSSYKKYLLVLSDGIPSDSGNLESIIKKLEKTGVKVISCYVSSAGHIEPRRLYDTDVSSMNSGARFMFKLSSKIKTDILPYKIFEKMEWSIDSKSNETKLFLQVNHPDNIYDACDLAKKLMTSQDALLDFLGTISLSSYTNGLIKDFAAKSQVGETCYANAVAAVIHLAMKRILKRTDGYPDFFELRDTIISAFGEHGASVLEVLERYCPYFRLQYEQVTEEEALTAITYKRPILATFDLTEKEWDIFSDFYEKDPTGILTRKEIDISKRDYVFEEELEGHAVVLTSFNSECLRFMNSWGEEWGDIGFFRVQNRTVLNCEYYDVFWTDDNLDKEEKSFYASNGISFAKTLVNKLRNIQSAEFICPECNKISRVPNFKGTLTHVECPICFHKFSCRNEGNVMAMNLYLTSLLK